MEREKIEILTKDEILKLDKETIFELEDKVWVYYKKLSKIKAYLEIDD